MDAQTILILLFVVAMAAMHLRGHGHGSGGHGHMGGHRNHDAEPVERPGTEPDKAASPAEDDAERRRHTHV